MGCGQHASGWTAKACGRRFALTTISTDPTGAANPWKETFFYGGKAVDRVEPRDHRDDLLGLHGPDPRRGPLSELPALWAWDGKQKARESLSRIRTLCENSPSLPLACEANRTAADGAARRCDQPRCSFLGVAACEGDNFHKSRASCKGQGANAPQPEGPCSHPACVRIAPKRAAWSGQFMSCKWEPRLKGLNDGKGDSYCLHSMGPWAKEGELNLSLVDFTPNYLCDATAMERIHRTAGAGAGQLRFIVVMRDPVYRAFSEWSMFSLGWNWDPIKNFSASIAAQVAKLQRCNESLFMRPRLLRSLPTAELGAYIDRCFGGGRAMAYVQTSMYGVCLLHALRYFRREQFLLLRYEDLMRMNARSVLGLLTRFTGLHPPPRGSPARLNCKPGAAKNRARNSYSGTSPVGAEFLNEAAPIMEHLFAPYNRLLRELVHPSFGWSRFDHYKRPLNATRRAAREAELRGYKEHLRNRQTKNLLAERRKRTENLEAARIRSGERRGKAAGGERRGKVGGGGRAGGKARGGKAKGRGAGKAGRGGTLTLPRARGGASI